MNLVQPIHHVPCPGRSVQCGEGQGPGAGHRQLLPLQPEGRAGRNCPAGAGV